MTAVTRPLPTNQELERKALSSVLIDPEMWHHLADLPAGVWTGQSTGSLFQVLADLHAAGKPIDDSEMIVQRASELGLGQWVNLAYIAGVLGSEVTGFYAEFYAADLLALHGRREAIRQSHKLIHHATEGDLSHDDLATLASQVGSGLDIRKRQDFTSHAQAVDAALADIESSTVNALSTGFRDLDESILGFEPGAMYVLAARPAMGKTAMGYSFVLNAAKTGTRCVVASLEMPAKQLATRSLATAAGVDLNKIRQRTTSGPERERLRSHANRARSLSIQYLESTEQTAASIARDARKLHATGQLDLLMVDYLQLVESGKGGNENRVQEVSLVSRTLKKLAMELQIPVIVLSQLSRAVEARENKRPKLSDLRESGAVEQDADTVLFIYRDEYYNKNTSDHGIAEIIIGKQRNGPVGTVRLSYSSEYVRFGSLSSNQSALL